MKNFLLFILAVPFCWSALAHDHHQEMKAEVPLSGSSVFQLDSTWKSQKGKSIKLSELAGCPRLVVMLYTHCETACPLIVEDLKHITKELKSSQQNQLGVTIFSIDPKRDTPQALAAFAKKRKLPKDWTLLTAGPHSVSGLAAALGIRYKRLANGDYIHSNVIFLLDRKGVVAARKEGLKTSSKDFIKEIQKVLANKA